MRRKRWLVTIAVSFASLVEGCTESDTESHAYPKPHGWAVEHQQSEQKTECRPQGDTDREPRPGL